MEKEEYIQRVGCYTNKETGMQYRFWGGEEQKVVFHAKGIVDVYGDNIQILDLVSDAEGDNFIVRGQTIWEKVKGFIRDKIK